ncbi:hypothetical protein, partial [Endozoicomonas sp. SESOKO3]|uniref:hypothetical protein n=1 Tax=Endozoicomonas sp. SESOKO3 TaxID=2828744 RepID=UPI0021483FFA
MLKYKKLTKVSDDQLSEIETHRKKIETLRKNIETLRKSLKTLHIKDADQVGLIREIQSRNYRQLDENVALLR